jgi:hypothetical protein
MASLRPTATVWWFGDTSEPAIDGEYATRWKF